MFIRSRTVKGVAPERYVYISPDRRVFLVMQVNNYLLYIPVKLYYFLGYETLS